MLKSTASGEPSFQARVICDGKVFGANSRERRSVRRFRIAHWNSRKLLYWYLDNVGRGRGYDHGQQSKPRYASLIKITDTEESDHVREEGDAEEPEIPLLLAIPFHRLPSGSYPGKAHVDERQKA